MRMTYFARALGLASLAALTACSRDLQLQERTVTPMLTTGGTARSADANATLTFAPGALRADTDVTIVTRRDRTAEGLRSFVYELGPSGLMFDASVTLSIAASRGEETLAIANLDGPAPVIVQGSSWDPATRTVSAPLAHFSSYGAVVVYDPCARHTCGDPCTLCAPGAVGCTEPEPAAKACDRSLVCVAEAAAVCSAGDGGTDAGPAPDAIPGDAVPLDAVPLDAVPDATPPDAGLDPADVEVGDATTATLACAVTFRQNPQPLIDILLVVDTSCSMAEEQATLAADFGLLLGTLTQNNVDYHLGVTTTDLDDPGPGNLGTLVPNPTVLTSSTPNLIAAFASHVTLGINGSAMEQGLGAAWLALTPPASTGANAGFLREHSGLLVLVLSDEDDFSSLTTDFFLHVLHSLREPEHVQLNTIAGDTPIGCATAAGAFRYEDVRVATQGAFSSICTPPWTSALTDLGGPTFGYRTRYQLTTGAGAASAVSVDGVPVPEVGTNGTRNWMFDGGTRTLIFSEGATPAPGAAITVLTGC